MNEFPRDPPSAVIAIDALLSYAAVLHASDIHIDPRKDDILVRFRIDGIMEEVGLLPRRLLEEIIARLKILSGARTDIHAMPQDGRFGSTVRDEQCHVRISFMPTYHGENAVLRLLPAKSGNEVTFSGLGFTPEHVHTMTAALTKTHGLILVTGPTGSGKTTTLQACLSLKVREPLSVIALEDPVEYEIPGVRHVHIRHTHGVTFAAGLRAVVRQDPDVIMVGEIRDAETAQVAIHTALTGHLVLSTLHTNSALETIARLSDMGVDHYLLASTLELIVAERLVRKVCLDCDGLSCEVCRGSGYSGRSVIAEVCAIDSGMKELILGKKSRAVLESYAKKHGFKPIAEDGAEKVEWGITSKEEVLRVLAS